MASGWLVKHRKIPSLWAEATKLEGNYKRRYFVIADSVLFYFTSEKAYQACDQNNRQALSKAAKGYLALYSWSLIENETLSKKGHSFVLENPSTNQSMLFVADSDSDKSHWITSIKSSQSLRRNLSVFDTPRLNLRPPDEGVRDEARVSSVSGAPISLIATVEVLEGRGLVARDMNGLSDPFCKVKFRYLEFSTSVVEKSLNPDWRERKERFEFLLTMEDMSSTEKIHLSCWDWDRFSADDFMGEADLDLSTFWDAYMRPIEKGIGLVQIVDGQRTELGEIRVRIILSVAGTNQYAIEDDSHEYHSHFGVPLASYAPNELSNGIPEPIDKMLLEIENRGLRAEGVFRLSGSRAEVSMYRALVCLNCEVDWSTVAIDTITGVLKSYLRELPEPLFPAALYDPILAIAKNTGEGSEAENEYIRQLRQVLEIFKLPSAHLQLLQRLFSICSQACNDETKMGPKSFAIVIGPNILRQPGLGDDSTVTDLPRITSVTELLVKHHLKILY